MSGQKRLCTARGLLDVLLTAPLRQKHYSSENQPDSPITDRQPVTSHPSLLDLPGTQ
jgi:hypothetical protein